MRSDNMEQILQKTLISQMKSKLHTVERGVGHNIQKFNNKKKKNSVYTTFKAHFKN